VSVIYVKYMYAYISSHVKGLKYSIKYFIPGFPWHFLTRKLTFLILVMVEIIVMGVKKMKLSFFLHI